MVRKKGKKTFGKSVAMSSRSFSPERLAKIRRLRKARRLFAKEPLFAYEQMKSEYQGYSYGEFLDDLRRRTKKKLRYKKSPLARYGRYKRIQSLITRYSNTKEQALIIQAKKLRDRITKPYRVLVRLGSEYTEYFFSPLISIERIERLTQSFNACKTKEEVAAVLADFERKGIIN